MDFVSKALGSLNMGLPFTLGDQVPEVTGQPWKLFDATLKKDGSAISVFNYDERDQAAAQNATAALRKLKLPGIVKHIDTVISGKHAYVLTERVQPFNIQKLSVEARKFVLQSVLKTLETMLSVANCTHNSVSYHTVLQSASTGLPLLVGFDLASSDKNSVPAFASLYNSIPFPPEGWQSTTLDTYQFGMLVADYLPDETRLIDSLRASRRPTVAKLASSNSAEKVLRNPISPVVARLSETALLSEQQLSELCDELTGLSPNLYTSLIKGSILPELIKTKSARTLRTNLVLISSLEDKSASTRPLSIPFGDEDLVSQYIASQFQSMDRVVRLELLRFLPQYIVLLSDKLVQQKIMSKMVFGFGDNEVMMRKASVAAVEYLTDKLTLRQLNTDLLRLLAKTHNDADADVRALTTTILCRIAPQLESRSVISTALSRALKDPVPKCRNAALRGVLQIDVPAVEIAEKLLGPAAAGMLDKDAQVSAEAWRVTDILLQKIHQASTSNGPAPAPSEHSHPADFPVTNRVSESRMQTPDAPSAVPTPLSTLRQAKVEHFDSPKEDDIQTGSDAWGWEADEAEDNDEVIQDAWGWNDDDDNINTMSKEEAKAIDDAWGW